MTFICFFFLFLILFCPKVVTTINMKEGYYPIDGCIKEDSFMENLQPKTYVLCALILAFKVQCIAETVFRIIDKILLDLCF